MASASSSSSSSLFIIAGPSPLPDDAIIVEGSDTDEDSFGSGARLRSVAERLASSFTTQGDLDDLCRKYGVSEQYSAVLPAGCERACSPPPPGAICVYEQALEAGMRFPLHGFFCEVLAHFGLAPSQIMPNGWRAMAGFVVLSHSAGVAPLLPVFRHFFTLCSSKFRWYYGFRVKYVAGMLLFKGFPHINDWKEAFFFLKSPTPWPCRVKWGELSKGSTVVPVLTREEQIVAKKLLRFHGKAVDITTYLSESNLAAAMITRSSANVPLPPTTTMTPPTRTTSSASAKGMDRSDTMKNLQVAKATQAEASGPITVKPEPGSDTPSLGKKMKGTEDAAKSGPSRPQPSTPLGSSAKPPPSIPTTGSASTKGMDPQVYDMMMNLRAAKAAQAQAPAAKLKSELASDAPWSGKKRKVAEDATKQGPSGPESSSPIDPAHALFSPSPPGFATRVRDGDPMPLNMAHKPDGGSTSSSNWENARQMLQSIVTPAMEQTFSASKPSDVIASSYIATLQAANYASFSLGYALELEEKLVAREREADALRQELLQAKAELADTKKAAADEVRSAAEAAVREFQGSTQQVLHLANHALAGHEEGMEEMKRAVLRRYPDLDLEQLDVPAYGGGAQ